MIPDKYTAWLDDCEGEQTGNERNAKSAGEFKPPSIRGAGLVVPQLPIQY
jgi:hypothetical protein